MIFLFIKTFCHRGHRDHRGLNTIKAMKYDAYLAGSKPETRNSSPKFYYILFFSVTSVSSVANEIKNPNFLGEKVGVLLI
jgi:hypothetical protein